MHRTSIDLGLTSFVDEVFVSAERAVAATVRRSARSRCKADVLAALDIAMLRRRRENDPGKRLAEVDGMATIS